MSVYIQITTICNFHCKHCCFGLGRESKGEHMSLETYRKVLEKFGPLIAEKDQYIALGGGEPTLHPDFWKIVEMALVYGYPWVATNGSRTEDSLFLCNLARAGVMGVSLSQDAWHDPIDERVTAAFRNGMKWTGNESWDSWVPIEQTHNGFIDRREIRSVKRPIRTEKVKGISDMRDGCCCPGLRIVPNGDFYACGCDDAPRIGSLDEGITDLQYKYYDIFNGCHKAMNPEYKEAANEAPDKQ
jgi:hypothetical protein